MPRHATQEIRLGMYDFSRGTMGDVNERGVRSPNWLAAADNLYGRPMRGMRIRPGSRNLSSRSLSIAPHSLMSFYSAGGNKLFVFDGVAIREVKADGYVDQTLPGGHPGTSDLSMNTNLDGRLIVTMRDTALSPLAYDGTSWKELKLPKPGAGPTFAANSAGGSVDARTNGPWYRVRWRHQNGSSLSGPATEAPDVVGPNLTVNISGNLNPGSPRSDYVGWTLERTKVNGTINGPFWFVADGTTATYADAASDASLGYIADEGVHGEPPAVDGVTSFAGRLWGWRGSSLYASQVPGDLEATGIANFDAELLYQVAKDDGDEIQLCFTVLDELLILKRRSVHVISGVDPESFVLRSIVYADPERGSEAGCCGPRAGCTIGGKAYFWGEFGGLFSYSKGTVKPEAWIEMGKYIDEANPAAFDFIKLINHQGNYMIAFYPTGGSVSANNQIVYDTRLKQWWHWKGWVARDAIELKSGLFNNATLVLADDTNRTFFPALTAGWEVTEAYVYIGGIAIPQYGTIQPGSVVGSSVPSGSTSFTMNLPALQTLFNATLIINGIEVPGCNTTAGSPVVTATGYNILAAFDSFKDRRDSTGFGGFPVSAMLETPWLDGGYPDEWKDLDRLAFAADGDVAVSMSIRTDPAGPDAGVQLVGSGGGNDWAADSGSFPDDLEWDVGDWASDAPSTSVSGVPLGTIGRRFKLVATAECSGDYRPSGIEGVATLLPDKEYNR